MREKCIISKMWAFKKGLTHRISFYRHVFTLSLNCYCRVVNFSIKNEHMLNILTLPTKISISNSIF